jgi:hypothetical protein
MKTIKKMFCLTMFVLLLGRTTLQAQGLAIIYTPHGSLVPYAGYYDEYTEEEIAALDLHYTQGWPDAILLNHSSAQYNCYGYAWYNSEGNMPYVWIDSPGEEVFWTDLSYLSAPTDADHEKIKYGSDHSAITTSTQGTFISKWADGPLMEHISDECPYDASELNYYSLNPDVTGVEDYLVIYSGPTVFSQNSNLTYWANFVDQYPYGDHIVGNLTWSLLIEEGEGEYVAATGQTALIQPWQFAFGSLPYGYYWYRDGSGRVLGRVKVTGVDNQGVLHVNYYSVYVTGVPGNTTSGTLAHNETWAYLNNITGTVTVPQGVVLRLLQGTVAKFASGASLVVNGTLSAVGTSSDSIRFDANSSTWSGIAIGGSGANGSTLKYATIRNVQTYGGSAVSVSGATGVTVQHCIISNNANYSTKGLYFASAGSPDVSYNTFSGNGGTAVVFYNTNGYFYKNTVTGNSGGVSCSNYASPSFGKAGFAAYQGNNVITTGSGGVSVATYSYPYIGSYNNSYIGYNSIIPTSGYRVTASNHCDVLAEQNWWGSASPNPSWFNTAGGSTIDWNPYLSSLPKISVMEASGETTFQATNGWDNYQLATSDSTLRIALGMRLSGDYENAKRQLTSLTTVSTTGDFARAVAQEILNLFRETHDKDLSVTLVNFVNFLKTTDPAILLILAHVANEGGDIAFAEAMYKQVVNDYPRTEFEKSARLSLFCLRLADTPNSPDAGAMLSGLLKDYPDDRDVNEAVWVFGLESGSTSEGRFGEKDSGTALMDPHAYQILSNFPNPFNPSTTFKYNLPLDGEISLVIYDVLGREVAVVAKGYHEAGDYSAAWNASNVASGVFFARFIVKNEYGVVKFTKVNKLLLMK